MFKKPWFKAQGTSLMSPEIREDPSETASSAYNSMATVMNPYKTTQEQANQQCSTDGRGHEPPS